MSGSPPTPERAVLRQDLWSRMQCTDLCGGIWQLTSLLRPERRRSRTVLCEARGAVPRANTTEHVPDKFYFS